MKEREINLIDLLTEILLRWRALIVWMLVGAVLLGGFSYVNSTRAAEAQKAALEQQKNQLKEQMKDKETAQDDLLKAITEIQKTNVLNVCEYEEVVEFYESSLYRQMNAAKVPKAELSYLVKTSVLENSYSIERLYEDTLESGLQQWLVENGHEDLGDISELVSLDRGTGAVETDSFCVQILHVSEEQCLKLAELVKKYIAAQQMSIAEQAGKHEIVLVNSTFAHVKDSDVLNQQNNLRSTISSIEASIDQRVAAFTDEEKTYYEFLTNVKLEEKEEAESETTDTEEAEQTEPVEIIIPGISIKYVILGMILFAFVYVCYFILKYIMNNKLRATDDMGELYEVPQLGLIPATASGKKLFGFVDRLILQLRDRNKRTFTAEEAVGLAGVAVKMAAKKEELGAVCCVGCDMKEGTLQVAEYIRSALKEEKLEMTVLNNVLYDQSAMEQLQGVKGAFLLEKAGETLYDEIVKELELLNRQDIKILGVVVVE